MIDNDNLKVKYCLKCKEYSIIREDDHKMNEKLKQFEKNHTAHPLTILNYSEVKGHLVK